MSDFIRIDVAGDRQAGIRFEEFPDALRDDLRKEISALSLELFGRIEARVPRLSGDLASNVRHQLFVDKDKITGRVAMDGRGTGKGSDFAKAGALEYGSTGKKFKVAAHSAALDHYWEEKLAAPITVLVKAHKRASTIGEHAFMRGPLQAMQPEVVERLNAVVERAVQEANR